MASLSRMRIIAGGDILEDMSPCQTEWSIFKGSVVCHALVVNFSFGRFHGHGIMRHEPKWIWNFISSHHQLSSSSSSSLSSSSDTSTLQETWVESRLCWQRTALYRDGDDDDDDDDHCDGDDDDDDDGDGDDDGDDVGDGDDGDGDDDDHGDGDDDADEGLYFTTILRWFFFAEW